MLTPPAAAALRNGSAHRRATFEVFARRLPEGRRYGIVAGTARFVEALAQFRFDYTALASVSDFLDDDTLGYLADYQFRGDVDGYAEGELYFPGSPVLKEVFRPVAAVHAAAASIPQRFTFTFPLINAAARVMFLVAGSENAKVLKAALTEPAGGLPASMVHPTNGRLTWLLDRPAAALLGVGKKR